MSVIFGIRKSRGSDIKQEELLPLAAATERFAQDGFFIQASGCVGMGFQPYHTTERSHLEMQPTADTRGDMLTFDGRLDNHADLQLQLGAGAALSDSALVLAAFERWGESCFSHFVGDWALALWCPRAQTIYLARDHAGTRSLYFHNVDGTLIWSTYLETFFANKRQHELDDQYVASYLCGLPLRELTPYRGIRAVPPAHYLVIRTDKIQQNAHWQAVADDEIIYKADVEYEEHFFALFKQAVKRRTSNADPILAQLSGGMDSTSIVCMSDHIRKSTNPSALLLDTISFYDDTEPHWDEKRYFSATEAYRGKTGIHIKVSNTNRTFAPPSSSQFLYLLPGADSASLEHEDTVWNRIGGQRYRAILSGIGGDEVLGGIPTPMPELADHLVSGNLITFIRQAMQWCLATRTPVLHTITGSAKFAFHLYFPPSSKKQTVPSWISQRLLYQFPNVQLNSARAYLRRLGVRASAINNERVWQSIAEALPHTHPEAITRFEYRYPYLDRDLVDFIFRIPRKQLVEPGRRRALMRRALRGIVPPEILNRKRKAYLVRGSLAVLQNPTHRLRELTISPKSVDYGFVEMEPLNEAVNLITSGKSLEQAPLLMKYLMFEIWLKSMSSRLASRTPYPSTALRSALL